jgi:hypothetical protein
MDPISKEDMERLLKDKDGNINPFHYDMWSMGMNFSKDVMYMYSGHFGDTHLGGYFINTKTGERQRLVIYEK